jgi:hypothetical protein
LGAPLESTPEETILHPHAICQFGPEDKNSRKINSINPRQRRILQTKTFVSSPKEIFNHGSHTYFFSKSDVLKELSNGAE